MISLQDSDTGMLPALNINQYSFQKDYKLNHLYLNCFYKGLYNNLLHYHSRNQLTLKNFPELLYLI